MQSEANWKCIVYCWFSLIMEMKTEENKIVHSLIFFYEKAATGYVL